MNETTLCIVGKRQEGGFLSWVDAMSAYEFSILPLKYYNTDHYILESKYQYDGEARREYGFDWNFSTSCLKILQRR
jgi:hypothetical protein